MLSRGTFALMLAATVGWQDAQRPPTFRTGAEVVRVDVTVIDSRGRPVTDLTANDFVIDEDGVRQQIQSFKFIELTGQRAPGDDLSLTITSRNHAATELARDDVRVFVVYWDEYHISPLVAAERMRFEVANFIRTMTGPTDVIALMDPWTPISDLTFTRDHDELAFAVSKLQGRQGVLLPPRNGAEENQMRHARSIPLARAQVAASALKSAIGYLGSLRQARSSVIYVGSDFAIGDDFMKTQELIDAANDANVAVYSISPEGLQTRSVNRAGIIRDLASNTGGEALRANAVTQGFRRVVEQARASYLLGYSPAPKRFDGKFHKIKVTVKKQGIDVRARNGYWAPDVAAMTRARTVAADSAVAPDVSAAFRQLVRLDRSETSAEGSAPRTILSPDPASPSLQLVVPRVWRIQRPADLAAALGNAPPLPYGGRVFTRTDRLLVRFALEGPLGRAATVSVGLLDRRGKRLTDLPFAVDASRPDAWMIDLPLTSISRGDYVLAVEAVSGEQRSAAYIPLRISAA
ncbi:MAG: VWA domain-containing protein [Vicinamibacterales bacterium]